MKRRAIYPGSFDPPTYGHIDIVRRSLEFADEVVVAVVYNPQKENYLFTPQERLDMFREELKEAGDRVLYDSFHGLLVDYVERMQAKIIIRGLRAASDFEYEFQMALMNRHMKPEMDTVFSDNRSGPFLYRGPSGQGNCQSERFRKGPRPAPCRKTTPREIRAADLTLTPSPLPEGAGRIVPSPLAG